jgi:glyceraldehyde 3-phosphate dehydrogenase
MIRVGINGFGRIGRAIYRINNERKLFNVVAINDINPDINNICYTLQYDTTYGRLAGKVTHRQNSIYVGDMSTKVFNENNISDVPWDECGVDIVIDSSGIQKNLRPMIEDSSSVKNFIVTHAPQEYKEDIKPIIFGVNENEINPSRQKVFSSSICDTIALSPILKIIQDSHMIESGFLTTLHPWLSYQNLLDGPSTSWSQPGDVYSHYALGRASTENLIPKSTSAILAADLIFPNLSKKIQSFSYRTPTKIVSSAVMILLLDKEMDVHELKEKFYSFQKFQKYSILHNSVEPLTSLDYAGQEHSAIIDHRWTKVENKRHLKIVYWYDNEWGYSSRVVDLISAIEERGKD